MLVLPQRERERERERGRGRGKEGKRDCIVVHIVVVEIVDTIRASLVEKRLG